MYHFQFERHDFTVGIRSSSSDNMKIFASEGPTGEPIATPAHGV